MAIAPPTKTAGKPVAAATKTAPKKAAANAVEFEIKFSTPGILKLTGVVDSINGGVLTLQHKKHASSKYALKPIPLENIRLIRGHCKKGETVEVIYYDEKAVFLRLRRAQLEGFDTEMGMSKGVDETGRPFLVPPRVCDATTMSEVVAPPIAVAKK